jgi:hypothetical protein
MAVHLIALSERLRKLSKQLTKQGRHTDAADLRLAALYLRRTAAIHIADEAKQERNPKRRRELEQESAELWCRYE